MRLDRPSLAVERIVLRTFQRWLAAVCQPLLYRWPDSGGPGPGGALHGAGSVLHCVAGEHFVGIVKHKGVERLIDLI